MYQDGPRTPEELIQMLDHDIQNEEFQVEAAGLSNAERRLNALASLALNDLNIFQKVMKEARLMDNEIISRSDWDRFTMPRWLLLLEILKLKYMLTAI